MRDARSDQQRDDSTENDESAVPLRSTLPRFYHFLSAFSRLIRLIDLPLSSQLFVAQMFENIRVVKQIYGGIFTRAITRIIILSE